MVDGGGAGLTRALFFGELLSFLPRHGQLNPEVSLPSLLEKQRPSEFSPPPPVDSLSSGEVLGPIALFSPHS